MNVCLCVHSGCFLLPSRPESLLFFHFPFNCVLGLHSGELMLFSARFYSLSPMFATISELNSFFSSFILLWCGVDVMYLHIHVLSRSLHHSHMFSPFSETLVFHYTAKPRKQRNRKLCSCSVKIKTMKNRNDEDGADDALDMRVRVGKRKHIVTNFFISILIWFKITSHR